MAATAHDLRRMQNGHVVNGSLAYDLDWAVRERELRHAGEAPKYQERNIVKEEPKVAPRVQVRERQKLSVATVAGFTAVIAMAVAWILLVKKGALLLIDSAGMCGVFIPLILSANLESYNEPLKINHIIGMLLLITSVLILYAYNNSVKPKLSFLTVVLLAFFGISNGVADFSGKAFNNASKGTVSAVIFNFYTYLFAFVVLGVFYVLLKRFSKSQNEPNKLISKSIVYIIIMAVSLYLTTFFKTLAADYLPSTALYPLYQASMLILNGAMGAIFFGEKITSKSIIAVVISILGIVFINII